MTKLLCITHYFESHRGGIELVAGRLNRELRQLGFDSRWAAAAVTPPPEDASLRSVPLAAWNGFEQITGLPMPVPSPKAVRALDRQVAEADVVMIHDALYFTSILAFLSARRHRKPIILVQHIAEIPFKSAILRGILRAANRLVTRPLMRRANQVVFISETVAGHFSGVRFARPPRTIFNGVDTSTFQPSASEAERRSTRAMLDIPHAEPVALFVGRFVEKKGLLRLREMARARPDIHFAFAGWGPLDPSDWHLANISVHRNRTGAELAQLYRAADVLVLPSTGEGFPLVIQEALACGLAVLCGADTADADPSARKFLKSAHVAIADDQSSARAFLEVLDRMLTTDRLREEATARRDFAVQRYSWTSCAREHALAIEALVRP